MTNGELFTREPEVERRNLRGVACMHCGGTVSKVREAVTQLPLSKNGDREYPVIIVRCDMCARVAYVLAEARTTAFCADCGNIIHLDFGCGCSGKGE